MLSHEGSWRDLQGRDDLRDVSECGIVLSSVKVFSTFERFMPHMLTQRKLELKGKMS